METDLKEPLIMENEYFNQDTQTNEQKTLAISNKFNDREKYLKKISTNVNLNVREVKGELTKVYEERYIVEIWKKQDASEPGEKIMYQQCFAQRPKSMNIMKNGAAFSIQVNGEQMIYVCQFENDIIHTITDPFAQQGGSETLYIDNSNLIATFKNKMTIYKIEKNFEGVTLQSEVDVQGNFEIAKLTPQNEVNIIIQSWKNQDVKDYLKEKGYDKIKKIVLCYDSIYFETHSQKVFSVDKNQIDEFPKEGCKALKSNFIEQLILKGNFYPLIFSNYYVKDQIIYLVHKNICCIKNLNTNQWQVLQLFTLHDEHKNSLFKGSTSALIHAYKDNSVLIIYQSLGYAMVIDQKYDGRFYAKGFRLPAMKNIYLVGNNALNFFINSELNKNQILCVGSDQEVKLFLNNLESNTNFIPICLEKEALTFGLFNTEKSEVKIFTKKISQSHDINEFGVSEFTLKECYNVKILKLQNSYLFYHDGIFTEYNRDKRKCITLNSKKSQYSAQELFSIDDRFIYVVTTSKQIVFFDLENLRNMSIKDIQEEPIAIFVTDSYLYSVMVDRHSENMTFASNALNIKILPYVHKPAIRLGKMLKDPFEYHYVQNNEYYIYALNKDYQFLQWELFTGKLVRIIDKTDTFKDLDIVQTTKCNRLLCREKIDHNLLPTTKIYYYLYEVQNQNEQCDIVLKKSYDFMHNRSLIVKYSKEFTRMVEGLGETKYYEFERDQWVLKRTIKNITSFDHISPDLQYFYSQKTFTIYNMNEEQIAVVPEYLRTGQYEVYFTVDEAITISTNQKIVRKLSFKDGQLVEQSRYLHKYNLPYITQQYHTSNVVILENQLETLQVLARLNDYYRYMYRFQQKFELNNLFQISDDFSQNKSYINFPFSFYHWTLLNNLEQKTLKIDQLPLNLIYELIYTILPSGDTFFHKCNKNQEAIDYLYNTVIKEELQKKPLLHIGSDVPFVMNLQKKSPLQVVVDDKNVRTAEIFIKIIRSLGFDTHYDEIDECLQDIFEFQLPSFTEYFDERVFDAKVMGINFERGCLKTVDECDFALTTSSLGENNIAKINEETCDSNENEVPLTVKVIDMPDAHKFNENGKRLMECLAETDVLEVFQNQSIRAIVEFKWGIIKNAIIKWLFIPNVLILITFAMYSLIIFEEQVRQTTPEGIIKYQLLSLIFIIAMLAEAFYLFMNELVQMKNKGFSSYFASPWNYLDLSPIILIVLAVFVHYILSDPTIERPINAFAAFFIWIKFLYFLRIFKGTGYLISMIIEVIADMRVFFAIFIVTLAAFGHCFYIFSLNQPGNEYITSFANSLTFTYRMALGDFSTDVFGEENLLLVWFLFISCTIFLLIVMLNLLIAIISDTFERVQEQANNTMYKSMAELIYENDYLLSESTIKQFNERCGSYLIISKAEKENEEDSGNAWEGKVRALKISMNAKHAELSEFLKKMKDETQNTNDKMEEKVEHIESNVNALVKSVSTIQKRIDLYFKFGGNQQESKVAKFTDLISKRDSSKIL